MDHPGFVATRMLDDRTLEARFHGWVKSEFFKGEHVRFFIDAGEVRGEIQDFTIGKDAACPSAYAFAWPNRSPPALAGHVGSG